MKTGLLKFKYGEEIICEYEKKETHTHIKNMTAMIAVENHNWQLVTWLPYAKIREGIDIPNSEILFLSDLSEDMEEYYIKWKEALEKKREVTFK